jgi:hypothetical protein
VTALLTLAGVVCEPLSFGQTPHLKAGMPASAVVVPAVPQPGCMPHLTAPLQHPNFILNGGNSGVRVEQFLDLTVHAKPINVIQGIDLSRVNIAPLTPLDMKKFKDCGAHFAFIQISKEQDLTKAQLAGVGKLWSDAEAAGIEVYPYHYLGVLYIKSFPKQGLPGKTYPYDQGSQQWQDLLIRFKAEGVRQANNFLAALTQMKPSGPSSLNFPKYVAVDIEEPLALPHPPGGTAETEYADAYVEMACAFIQQVHSAHPDTQTLLYTDVQMQREYNIGNVNFANDDCLHGVPVWLAYPTPQGGHPADMPTDKAGKRVAARNLCIAESDPKFDRCHFQQYTSAANFGYTDLRKGKSKGQPIYLDLDRYQMDQFSWDGP